MCYYQTAYQRGVPGRVPVEEDRGENFADIHSVGQRTSKYMDYQVKTAPLLSRSACASTVYSAKPLGGSNVNRMLAENFKDGVSRAPKGLDVVLDGTTEYESSFPRVDCGDMEKARQKSAAEAQGGNVFVRTKTLGGSGHSLETRSHTHMKYVTPDMGVAKPTKVILPRQSLDLGGAARGASTRTSHQRWFAPGSGLPAAAARGLSLSSSAPDLSGPLRGTRPDVVEPAVETTRRAPFMSPGQ